MEAFPLFRRNTRRYHLANSRPPAPCTERPEYYFRF